MESTPLPGEAADIPLPERFEARIVGDIQYRVGDGALEDLPKGKTVQVEVAMASMVVSWESEGQPVTATLAQEEFQLHLKNGDITM